MSVPVGVFVVHVPQFRSTSSRSVALAHSKLMPATTDPPRETCADLHSRVLSSVSANAKPVRDGAHLFVLPFVLKLSPLQSTRGIISALDRSSFQGHAVFHAQDRPGSSLTLPRRPPVAIPFFSL